MNDSLFCTNFVFNEYCYSETAHTDNSHGVNYHFLGFIKHGRGRILSDRQALEIGEGEMFYIPKGAKYRSYWIAEDYVQFDSIGFLYFPTSAPGGYKLQKIPFDDAIFSAFRPLSESKTVSTASIGALYQLLARLELILEAAPTKKENAIYEQLLTLLQKNPHMAVPEYAALCNVSESLLYHYVKQASDKTPNRLRQEALCQKAALLLSTTSFTVEEICDRLGFGSAAYFRRVFESVYHKTPSALRKEKNKI